VAEPAWTGPARPKPRARRTALPPPIETPDRKPARAEIDHRLEIFLNAFGKPADHHAFGARCCRAQMAPAQRRSVRHIEAAPDKAGWFEKPCRQIGCRLRVVSKRFCTGTKAQSGPGAGEVRWVFSSEASRPHTAKLWQQITHRRISRSCVRCCAACNKHDRDMRCRQVSDRIGPIKEPAKQRDRFRITSYARLRHYVP